jgi:hypothetical protein
MSSLLLIDAGLFTTSVISYESKGIFDSRQEKNPVLLKDTNSVAKWHTYSVTAGLWRPFTLSYSWKITNI